MPILLVSFQVYSLLFFLRSSFFFFFFLLRKKPIFFISLQYLWLQSLTWNHCVAGDWGRWLQHTAVASPGEQWLAFDSSSACNSQICEGRFEVYCTCVVGSVCKGSVTQVLNRLPSLGLWCVFFVVFFHTSMHTGHWCLPGETMRLKRILICQFMCRPFVTHSHKTSANSFWGILRYIQF